MNQQPNYKHLKDILCFEIKHLNTVINLLRNIFFKTKKRNKTDKQLFLLKKSQLAKILP